MMPPMTWLKSRKSFRFHLSRPHAFIYKPRAMHYKDDDKKSRSHAQAWERENG
jgi:hypothetical protein